MTEANYAAMRAYIDVAVELQVEKRMNAIRSAQPVETRAAEPVVCPAGKDGRDGKDGIDGKDGVNGKDGERGADGLKGGDGKDGLAGRDGAIGPKGERGVDGIATREEIEAIVESRFAEIQTRSFADIYRGVFKPGETYKRGEFVTWDGSLHLALNDTTEKPMTGAGWQLVAKRGRDR